MLDIFLERTLKTNWSLATPNVVWRAVAAATAVEALENLEIHAVSPPTPHLLNENLQFSKTPGGSHARQSPGPGTSISGHLLSTALVRGQSGEYNKLFTPEPVA